MKILVAGIIALSFGGVTWCSLMLLLGLRAWSRGAVSRGTGECIYDPEQNTRSEDPSALATSTNALAVRVG